MSETVIDPTVKAAERIFEFTVGIFGFPAVKRYAVTDIPGGGEVFKQMSALDDPNIGFTLVYPFAFFPDYAPEIPDEEAAEIGAAAPDQVVLMTIAMVPQQIKDATVNLKAPILFNPHTRKARQVILADDRYTTRHRLFKA